MKQKKNPQIKTRNANQLSNIKRSKYERTIKKNLMGNLFRMFLLFACAYYPSLLLSFVKLLRRYFVNSPSQVQYFHSFRTAIKELGKRFNWVQNYLGKISVFLLEILADFLFYHEPKSISTGIQDTCWIISDGNGP